MRVVLVDAPESMIEERRRKGLDRRDEMWEGVYHVAPPPNEEHQIVVDETFVLFTNYVRRHGLGVLRSNKGVRNVRSVDEDYRIPEWIFLRAERQHLLRKGSPYVDEGPDVILDVRSPGDETDAKIPHYERVEVRELVLVDRDSLKVQILRLVAGHFAPVSPSPEGWTYCEGLKAFFRTGESAGRPVLRVLLELDGTEHVV